MAVSWSSFLSDLARAKASTALLAPDRPILALDDKIPHGAVGVSLEKKSSNNPPGQPWASLFQLVHDISFPLANPALPLLRGFSDLTQHMGILAHDASPDTVISAVFFTARQAGVNIPADIWEHWLPEIGTWEVTGNSETPEQSWPALASALAHRQFGIAKSRIHSPLAQIAQAWDQVVPFLAETLRAGHDPAAIPLDACGPYVVAARMALAEERESYIRKSLAANQGQLSLPLTGTGRRRLVDALLTREAELAGAMKVLARNDRAGSPLGQGFSFLCVERRELHDVLPENWMTISVDPRLGVNLRDLWVELERLETEAWQQAGQERPKAHLGSRQIPAIDRADRVYDEPWYLDPTETLLASPKRSCETGPGSRLDSYAVHRALFRVYDPMTQPLVNQVASERSSTETSVPLVEVQDSLIRTMDGRSTSKSILTAWWPADEPLPHPARITPLPPIAFRAMAARTSGVPSDCAYVDAHDAEDFDVVPFSNSLAVVSDDGVFLLDCGRGGRSRLQNAAQLVERQARLSAELDQIQESVLDKSANLGGELQQSGSVVDSIVRQRQYAAFTARLIELRGKLDVPLKTNEAGLEPLKTALARRWNTSHRLSDLIQEVEALDRINRTTEELRIFRSGRLAAGVALGLVTADALLEPVTQAIDLAPHFGSAAVLITFGGLFAGAILLAWLVERVLRQTLRIRD